MSEEKSTTLSMPMGGGGLGGEETSISCDSVTACPRKVMCCWKVFIPELGDHPAIPCAVHDWESRCSNGWLSSQKG